MWRSSGRDPRRSRTSWRTSSLPRPGPWPSARSGRRRPRGRRPRAARARGCRIDPSASRRSCADSHANGRPVTTNRAPARDAGVAAMTRRAPPLPAAAAPPAARPPRASRRASRRGSPQASEAVAAVPLHAESQLVPRGRGGHAPGGPRRDPGGDRRLRRRGARRRRPAPRRARAPASATSSAPRSAIGAPLPCAQAEQRAPELLMLISRQPISFVVVGRLGTASPPRRRPLRRSERRRT